MQEGNMTLTSLAVDLSNDAVPGQLNQAQRPIDSKYLGKAVGRQFDKVREEVRGHEIASETSRRRSDDTYRHSR